MAELPTCLCARGLPPYDRLTAIYQAAAELSGDTSLPDAMCVAGVPPFSRFPYIYEAFRILADDSDLPSQSCVSGESPQDQVSRIYQAVAIYAPDSSLKSYACVRGMPIWQQWIEIYRALYLAAGSPESLVSPDCVNIASLDVLSDVFCALTAGGNATLLASFYIPEIVDSFERGQAAGYSGSGDADTFQREAAIDVIRDGHYQSGIDGQLVILEDDPTECVLVAPGNVEGVGGTEQFDASWDAIPITLSLLRYEWRLDNTGSWTPNATSTSLTGVPATEGGHILNVRAVSTSGVLGDVGDSPEFEVDGSGLDVSFVTGVTLGGTIAPSDQKGMKFTVGGAGITITEVGIYGNPTHYSPSIDVFIRASDGTNLGSATVTWGTGAQFYYAVLSSPVDLSPATVYYLMSDALVFNDVYDGATIVTTTSVATVTNSAFGQPPTADNVGSVCYCPLNFLYHLT